MRDATGRTLREGDVCRDKVERWSVFFYGGIGTKAHVMALSCSQSYNTDASSLTILRRSGQPIDDVAPLWKDCNGVLIEVGCEVDFPGNVVMAMHSTGANRWVLIRSAAGSLHSFKDHRVTVLPPTRTYRVTGPGELTLPEGWTVEAVE